MITLHQLAKALGGEVTGGQVVAPAPGHSRRDRSLAVRPSIKAPGGFVVHGFAGDDWCGCRDHVASALGIEPGAVQRFEPAHGSDRSEAGRIERAQQLWHASRDPRGSVVERYLTSRGLDLPAAAAVGVVRYHPQCPWKDEQVGFTIKVPAMVAAMRSLETRQITAIHRTRLTDDGRKVDRRMTGVAGGTAIMLDHVDGAELVVGEGIEGCLAAGQLGFRPVWALASAGGIGAFPVLRGVDKLTILGERDGASETVVTACHGTWTHAGRHVAVVLPNVGKDMNDALVAGARTT